MLHPVLDIKHPHNLFSYTDQRETKGPHLASVTFGLQYAKLGLCYQSFKAATIVIAVARDKLQRRNTPVVEWSLIHKSDASQIATV